MCVKTQLPLQQPAGYQALGEIGHTLESRSAVLSELFLFNIGCFWCHVSHVPLLALLGVHYFKISTTAAATAASEDEITLMWLIQLAVLWYHRWCLHHSRFVFL